MIESFQEEWVENDLNPITVFDSAGKILYLNNEASYLLSKVDKKHLYDLALQYAPQNYGFATQ
jgi:nitrogen-specific signal transduction histidine kinase